MNKTLIPIEKKIRDKFLEHRGRRRDWSQKEGYHDTMTESDFAQALVEFIQSSDDKTISTIRKINVKTVHYLPEYWKVRKPL
ncbi:MAG: hypothetical protein JETCAE03_34590 [Ignavibacteriaceae bacterium]|jgi:lipoate-protein ligase A|nr:MAG: hypothetical protein JETCAE03_34590 [Ignavibacteriaceae bacterium]